MARRWPLPCRLGQRCHPGHLVDPCEPTVCWNLLPERLPRHAEAQHLKAAAASDLILNWNGRVPMWNLILNVRLPIVYPKRFRAPPRNGPQTGRNVLC
jgi:hypothetical protein